MLRWFGRVVSVATLSVSLVAGSTGDALARGGRGGGAGAMRGGGGGHRGGGSYGGGAARMGGGHQGGGAARTGQHSGRAAGPQSRPANVGAGNRNFNTGTAGNRNVGTGNRQANIDRSRTNIDRSRDVNFNRNTYVRPAAGGYARAPYAYGGRRFYGNYGYRYHAYRPYGWGVGFYPVGAFVGALAATAAIVTLADMTYHYNAGVWYAPYDNGYTVVAAPIGATVATVPPETVRVENNYYYYGGAYYEKEGDKYKVVAPKAGTVVEKLPEGGEEVTVGDRKYVKFGETYYQPIEKDGKQMYEVVEVKEGEK
jgi:hypothetical protein